MGLARRFFVAVGALFVVGVLFLARRSALAPLEQQASLGKDVLLGSPLDLGSAHAITWDVPVGRWAAPERARPKLSLLVDRLPGGACDVKGASPLRVRVSALGLLDSGEQYDRLIRNWYYTTDEPFVGTAKLWEAGGPKHKEFGLGASLYTQTSECAFPSMC